MSNKTSYNLSENLTVSEAKKTWKLGKVSFGQGFENSKYYQMETVELKEYKGADEYVKIPSLIGKKPVSVIGAGAFSNNSNLKHIIIPDNVIRIEDYAFEGCCNLESITIEGNEINIGSGAFRDCSMLSDFSCAAINVKLGIQPFYGCVHLMDDNGLIILILQGQKTLCGCQMPIKYEEIQIPDGVERIDGRVFSYSFRLGRKDNDVVKKLRRVIVPESVKIISGGSFSAENLQEVVLQEGLEELSDVGVFSNCSSLKELHLPSSIKKLNPYFIRTTGQIETVLYAEKGGYVEEFVKEHEKYGYKFAVEGSQGTNHNQLQDFIIESGVLKKYIGDSEIIEIPEGVQEIGSFAFSQNTKISSLHIPSSLAKIGEYAFVNCSSLKKIIVPENVRVIAGNAFSSSGLVEVSFLNGINEIGEQAFSFCQLKEVVIPGTVKNIGKGAFSYNWASLRKVTIETGVEIIGVEAFAGDGLLEEICIPDSVVIIGDKAFANCKKLKRTSIPKRFEKIEKLF